jgi:hypothetical protein
MPQFSRRLSGGEFPTEREAPRAPTPPHENAHARRLRMTDYARYALLWMKNAQAPDASVNELSRHRKYEDFCTYCLLVDAAAGSVKSAQHKSAGWSRQPSSTFQRD